MGESRLKGLIMRSYLFALNALFSIPGNAPFERLLIILEPQLIFAKGENLHAAGEDPKYASIFAFNSASERSVFFSIGFGSKHRWAVQTHGLPNQRGANSVTS